MSESNALVFVDCETGTVMPHRLPWDIGMVIYGPDGRRSELSLIIEDVDLSAAERYALEYGHFSTRHPLMSDTREAGTQVVSEREAAELVFQTVYGATISGIVVDFDTTALDNLLRRNGLCWPGWHHLDDVESRLKQALTTNAFHIASVREAHRELLAAINTPPYRCKTDDLAAAFGIPPVPEDERHTGIGDARLAEKMFLAAVHNVIPLPGVQWPVVLSGLTDQVPRVVGVELAAVL